MAQSEVRAENVFSLVEEILSFPRCSPAAEVESCSGDHSSSGMGPAMDRMDTPVLGGSLPPTPVQEEISIASMLTGLFQPPEPAPTLVEAAAMGSSLTQELLEACIQKTKEDAQAIIDAEVVPEAPEPFEMQSTGSERSEGVATPSTPERPSFDLYDHFQGITTSEEEGRPPVASEPVASDTHTPVKAPQTAPGQLSVLEEALGRFTSDEGPESGRESPVFGKKAERKTKAGKQPKDAALHKQMTEELKRAKVGREKAMAALRTIRKTKKSEKKAAARAAPPTKEQEEARGRVLRRQAGRETANPTSILTAGMIRSAEEEVAARKESQRTARRTRRPPWIKEIMKLQRNTDLIIPKAPFTRLCKEVLADVKPDFRIQATAVGALQESSEQFLTGTMEDCNLVAIHAKRVTIMPRDIRLVERLRKGK